MPPGSSGQLPDEILCRTPEDTVAAGRSIASALLQIPGAAPVVIALSGPLGAGKTTFVKGVGLALGIREQITSPTFALVAEYADTHSGSERVALTHVDLYRVESAAALESLALDDLVRTTRLMVVEWAERAKDLLPARTLSVHLAIIPPATRRLTLAA